MNSLLQASVIRILSNVTGVDGHDDHDGHDHDAEILEDFEYGYDSVAFHDSHDDESVGGFVAQGHVLHSDKPWSQVIAASLIINLASLSGIILVLFTVTLPRLRKKQSTSTATEQLSAQHTVSKGLLDNLLLPSFASGALLATCVFLLIPEALQMLSAAESIRGSGGDGHDHRRVLLKMGRRYLEDHDHDHDHDDHDDAYHDEELYYEDEHDSHDTDKETEVFWKFGAALLGGYLLPLFFGILFPPPHLPAEPCPRCAEAEHALAAQLTISAPFILPQGETNGGSTCAGDCSKPCCSACSEQCSVQESLLEDNQDNNNSKRNITENVEAGGDNERSGSANGNDHNHTITSGEEKGEIKVDDKDEEVAAPTTSQHNDRCPTHNATGSATCRAKEKDMVKQQIDWSLAASILLGDFFHNFTDGIFVGNAFLFCSNNIAYTIAATTLYHEFAQELADFCLLTNHCGLKVWQALILNFISGLSVLIGAILIVSVDISTHSTGIVLAISAGVYIYISASECIPRVQHFYKETKAQRVTTMHQLASIFFFMLGAIPIGLVLLNHSHGC